MTTSELISNLMADSALVDALSKASSLAEVAAIAQEKGHNISEAELEQILDSEEFANIPLSAEQLALISGGAGYWGSKQRSGGEHLK